MKVQRKGACLALCTILLATLGFRHYAEVLERQPRVDIALEDLPMELGKWKGQDTEGLDIRSQDILRLTRYVKRAYKDPEGNLVFVYIGYWKEQSGEYQAAKHSPELCLPSNGWLIQRLGAKSLELDPESLEAKRILGEYSNDSYLFYYWFFTGKQNYTEEWRALLNISLQTIFAGRSDGGIVEISAPLKGAWGKDAEAKAAETVESFLSELYPALDALISNPTIIASESEATSN